MNFLKAVFFHHAGVKITSE